ncbi:MAG: PDGLE domain-containing protein [Dehalococcoidia bacterium]
MIPQRRYLGILIAGIGIALIVTLFSPWASSHPDGLERVAEDKEFIDRAEAEPKYEVIPDYQFPGVDNERVATVLAGITGVIAVAAILLGAGMFLSRGRDDAEPSSLTAGGG